MSHFRVIRDKNWVGVVDSAHARVVAGVAVCGEDIDRPARALVQVSLMNDGSDDEARWRFGR